MANTHEDESKPAPADAPKATADRPTAAPPRPQPQPQQAAPKGAPQSSPQSPRKADGTTPPTLDEGEAIPSNPMTRENMDAPAARDVPATTAATDTAPGRRVAKPPRFGPMPGPKELEKARKARFGDGPGSVRVDAAPANSGPDAEATQLVFVDGRGQIVGREAYVPGNYR